MDGFVYDNERIRQIQDLLLTQNRRDLVEYLGYLCETLISLEHEEYETASEDEEDIEVGMTEDGFYYLR
jgi:hypothetical protein